jgi:hypothetical protein
MDAGGREVEGGGEGGGREGGGEGGGGGEHLQQLLGSGAILLFFDQAKHAQGVTNEQRPGTSRCMNCARALTSRNQKTGGSRLRGQPEWAVAALVQETTLSWGGCERVRKVQGDDCMRRQRYTLWP